MLPSLIYMANQLIDIIMKKSLFIINVLLLFASLSAAAQQYGYGSDYYGNNMNGYQRNTKPSKAEEAMAKQKMEKEKDKFIEGYIDQLKIELNLDELQYIAVKQIIMESIRNQSVIEKKEEDPEAKQKAMAELGLTTETKIKALLSKEQIEKYNLLKENPKKKNKR